MRTVIEDCGRFDWSLAVHPETGDVVASRHLPGETSTWYSTEDHPTRVRDRSRYGLEPVAVIQHYVSESQTESSVGALRVRVWDALEATASEVPA